MKTLALLFISVSALALSSGCAPPKSYVLVGTKHTPIKPTQVKIYSHPPAKYEKVALLPSGGECCMLRPTNVISIAMLPDEKDLKLRAAKLGANGVLIKSDPGDQVAGSISNGVWHASPPESPGPLLKLKAASGMAIYVTQE